jgi:hypothetical protein
MRKEIRINTTHYHGETAQHIVLNETDVIANVSEVFGDQLASIVSIAFDKGEDFNMVERFCQFVGVLRGESHIGRFGLSLSLYDFHSKSDNVLDALLLLIANDWPISLREKFTRIAHDIINDSDGEKADVVVVSTMLGE